MSSWAHDPSTLAQVPVEEVLENGYTAARDEQTQIAATATLPIPTGAQASGPAPTAVMPTAEDTPAAEPSQPASGPQRATHGLASLVNTEQNKQPGEPSSGESSPIPPQRGTVDAGQPPLPPRSERKQKTALSWLVGAGILIIALAGGWFLLDTFLFSNSGQPSEVTPVDDATRDTSQENTDVRSPSPSDVDPNTATSNGTGHPDGELSPSMPPDDASPSAPAGDSYLNPTAPGEEPGHGSPTGEEMPGYPTGGGVEESGSGESEHPGTGSSGGSGDPGGAGRVAVSPGTP